MCIRDRYASVPEDYWKACEVGGRIYGVPTYKDSSQSEYVVWDKAKIEAAGYDYTKELGITDLDAVSYTHLRKCICVWMWAVRKSRLHLWIKEEIFWHLSAISRQWPARTGKRLSLIHI